MELPEGAYYKRAGITKKILFYKQADVYIYQ